MNGGHNMTDNDVISILNELWRYEHTTKYTDSQIRFACEYAINKIRAYNDLARMHKALSLEFADYVELKKHEIPLPDNY